MVINAANNRYNNDLTVKATLINKEEHLRAVEKLIAKNFQRIKTNKIKVA
jgi:hypothetical protein